VNENVTAVGALLLKANSWHMVAQRCYEMPEDHPSMRPAIAAKIIRSHSLPVRHAARNRLKFKVEGAVNKDLFTAPTTTV
jgi:hypothetical protein